MTDWALIGGQDPAPGDPPQLRMRLRRVDQAADDMQELSRELSRISRGTDDADWRGEAADAMRKVLDDFRYDLHPIASSFENISQVLGRYATDVEQLQNEARQALRRAKLAEERRQVAERQRSSAAVALAAQRRSLLARQGEELAHRAASTITIDPATAAAEADQGQRLAHETARAQNELHQASDQVRRHEVAISAAKSEVAQEKRAAEAIRQRWETASNTAKTGVEGALSSQLLNLSNLEKALRKLGDGVDAIGRFLQDPIPYLAELRKIIDKLQAIVSKLSMVIGILAIVAAVLTPFFPVLAPVAALLLLVSKGLAVVALGLAAAKLVTGMILWGNRAEQGGKQMVTTGDLLGDVVDTGFAALSVALIGQGGLNAKNVKFNPARGTPEWHKVQKYSYNAWTRKALFRGGALPADFGRVIRSDVADSAREAAPYIMDMADDKVLDKANDMVREEFKRSPGRATIRVLLPAPIGLVMSASSMGTGPSTTKSAGGAWR